MKIDIYQKIKKAAIAHQEGNLAEAEQLYYEVLKIQPNHLDTNYNLGIIMLSKNNFKNAFKLFNTVLDTDSNFYLAHYNLGIVLLNLGHLDEAEKSYKQAIILNPEFSDAIFRLGSLLNHLKRFDEAEDTYNKALLLKPMDSNILLGRGEVFLNKEKYELALKDFDKSKLEKAKHRALICLYKLGRKDEIYKRIKDETNNKVENLNFASFSSFISFRYKKNTANNFCKNPLDFIHISNLSSHVKNLDLFIVDLINELKNIKVSKDPLGKTTKNGFQTIPHLNIFQNPSEKLKNLQSIISEERKSYHLKFKNKNCTFIEKFLLAKNLYGWHVILKKQGYQEPHIHPSAWLSGVIYLKVVPSLKKNEGSIELSLNSKEYYDSEIPKIIHQPKVGDIILFPSSVYHRTIPFTTNTDRIVIAFDLSLEKMV